LIFFASIFKGEPDQDNLFISLSEIAWGLQVSGMSEASTKPSRPLLFAAGFYVAASLYLLAFTLSDTDLLSLSALAVASVVAGVGLYMLKRWGFWLSIVVFPLLATVSGSTLLFSMSVPVENAGLEATLFDLSLGVILLFSFVSVLIVLDNRSNFK